MAFEAERNNLFSFPKLDLEPFEREPSVTSFGLSSRKEFIQGKIVHEFDYIVVSSNHVFLTGFAFLRNMTNLGATSSVMLRGPSEAVYYLPLMDRKRPDLADKFQRQDLGQAGFFGVMKRDSIPAGTYRVFLSVEILGMNLYTDTGTDLRLDKETVI